MQDYTDIKIGAKFNSYYECGELAGVIEITKITSSYVWVTLTNKRGHTFPASQVYYKKCLVNLQNKAWILINQI